MSYFRLVVGINKQILYLYNALGQKVKKVVTNDTIVDTTEYLYSFQYKNNVLQFFPTTEGYVNYTAGSSVASNYNYVYNYLDHLGNIRLSYTRDPVGGNLKILQENHYYPFGLRHANYNIDEFHYEPESPWIGGGSGGIKINPVMPGYESYDYRYNGKEYQDELGLNLYDYGARNYDPALGRWMNIDPLAETSRRWSPYTYAYNNPIYFIDPDGMEASPGDFKDEKGRQIGSDGKADGKVYVVKTGEKSFGPQGKDVAGAGLDKSTRNGAVDFVKNNDGNTDAFNSNPEVYNSFQEIEGSESNRQGIVDSVSKDDGTGGTAATNNQEHGAVVTTGGNVVPRESGSVIDPTKVSAASISTPNDMSTVKSSAHSHPSGSKEGNDGRTYSISQPPSRADVRAATGGRTNYVIGKGSGKVYIYNSSGVQATVPLKNFVKLK